MGLKTKYVIKRTPIEFDFETIMNVSSNNHNYQENLNLNVMIRHAYKVVEKNLNEFQISKCLENLNIIPKALESNIIVLPKLNLLLVESLLTYGGEILSNNEEFRETKRKNIEYSSQIIDQMIKLLLKLEFLGIAQNDIKPANFVIQKNNDNTFSLRLIDLDIYNFLPYFNILNLKRISDAYDFFDDKMEISYLKGYTPVYAAPEIIQNKNSKEKNLNQQDFEIDLSKCQIYSFGIILLEFISFFELENNLKGFDSYKSSITEYKEIEKKIDNFYNLCKDGFIRKVIILANLCLAYSPEERPSAFELNEIFNGFSFKDIPDDYILTKYFMLKDQLKDSKKKYDLTEKKNVEHLKASLEFVRSTNNQEVIEILKIIISCLQFRISINPEHKIDSEAQKDFINNLFPRIPNDFLQRIGIFIPH